MATDIADTAPPPRSKRLKADTNETHDRLDKRIMAGDPFASRENYARFLSVQYPFHRDIEALYTYPVLAALLPDLEARSRLARIGDDLADLGRPLPPPDGPAPFAPGAIDLPTALGWLYVAEGSNLGAAFLFKAARAIGLDENFGARHLAGHPDGRAQHWREFTAALDGLHLTEAEEAWMTAGAEAAFRRVHALVDAAFA